MFNLARRLGLAWLLVATTFIVTEAPRRVPVRRAQRPSVRLLAGDIQPSTEARYTSKVEALDRFVREHGGVGLSDLLREGEAQALIVWTLTFLQLGYDTQLLSLSDAANLVCGLKRWFALQIVVTPLKVCLLYTSPSPRDS